VMTMVAERAGLPLLPPLPVSRLRQGFYGPARPGSQPSFHPPCQTSGGVWRPRGEWRQPLRTKAPVATWAGILRVQGHSDTAEGRRPPLSRDREMLEYLDKIFRLGAQMAAAAASNLGVLGVSLITPQQDT